MNKQCTFFCAVLLLAASIASHAAAPTGTASLKLLRYGEPGKEKPGLLDSDGNIRDLSRVVRDITPDVLGSASMARLAALDARKLPKVSGSPRLGLPVKGTRKIVAIGLNYVEHAREGGSEPPKEPIIFQKAVTALNGPNDDVVRPMGSKALDYEAELVIVIGKTARYVSEAQAGDYIAGYAVGDDVSERDFQLRHEGQWTKGKSADTFAPWGPYLVAASSVDEEHLGIWLKVNGQQRQNANSSEMIFKPKFLVSYVSRFMTLEPGDIIYSGTPPGVGNGMKPPTYLQPGDVITLGIDGLGEEQQHVVAWESTAASTPVAQLEELERQRCAAITNGNIAALSAMLTDDYVHVHRTGRHEDKATFLAGIRERPRITERGPLTLRSYGDEWVITGEQTNRGTNADGTPNVTRNYATQVARHTASGWQFVSMHVTPITQGVEATNTTATAPAAGAEQVDAAGKAGAAMREVRALEAKRTGAIAKADFAALADALADDYVHVFGDGHRNGKAEYIETVRAAPRVPLRGPLTVRLYGDDFAVVTGDLLNRIRTPGQAERVIDAYVTQIARRQNGRWQFVSFAITPKTSGG